MELGLTQADVVAQGGPSAQTLRGIENGNPGHEPAAWTIAGLERVLQMPRGTYEALLDGGDLPDVEPVDAVDLRAQARNLMQRADRAARTAGDVTGVRSMRLPDELWEAAVQVADEEGRPVSALVRDAIRAYLDSQ